MPTEYINGRVESDEQRQTVYSDLFEGLVVDSISVSYRSLLTQL